MELRPHDDVATFAALAFPLLAADAARNTLALTVLDAASRGHGAPHLMATVHDRDAVVGAVLRTAGRQALVSAVRPEDARTVEPALSVADPDVPGLSGPEDVVAALAGVHRERTGSVPRVETRLRLFVLGALVVPPGVPGAARPATDADRDLLAAWYAAFSAEADRGRHDAAAARAAAEAGLALGYGNVLWQVADVPVALAVARTPVAGMVRVGPVYTPPAHRRRGFGGAVTAAATRWALDAGAEQVVLFTDLANRTTNRLYPRLGYRPRYDAVEVSYD